MAQLSQNFTTINDMKFPDMTNGCVCVCVPTRMWFDVSFGWSHLGSGLCVCVIQNSKKSDILLVEHHNIKGVQYILDERQWN